MGLSGQWDRNPRVVRLYAIPPSVTGGSRRGHPELDLMQPPQKFCNVVYTWAVASSRKREQWEWDSTPLWAAVKSSTIARAGRGRG